MTTRIDAAYDKEFEQILEKLHLLEALKEGTLRCAFCQNEITLENVHGVFSKNHSLHVSCDRLPCHTKLVEHQKDQPAL